MLHRVNLAAPFAAVRETWQRTMHATQVVDPKVFGGMAATYAPTQSLAQTWAAEGPSLKSVTWAPALAAARQGYALSFALAVQVERLLRLPTAALGVCVGLLAMPLYCAAALWTRPAQEDVGKSLRQAASRGFADGLHANQLAAADVLRTGAVALGTVAAGVGLIALPVACLLAPVTYPAAKAWQHLRPAPAPLPKLSAEVLLGILHALPSTTPTATEVADLARLRLVSRSFRAEIDATFPNLFPCLVSAQAQQYFSTQDEQMAPALAAALPRARALTLAVGLPPHQQTLAVPPWAGFAAPTQLPSRAEAMDKLAHLMQQVPALASLRLPGSMLDGDASRALRVGQLHGLQLLDLSHVELQTRRGEMLPLVLPPNLTHLYLRNTGLNERGVDMLLDAPMPKLTVLDLRDNAFTAGLHARRNPRFRNPPPQLPSLPLAQWPNLTDLYLAGNRHLSATHLPLAAAGSLRRLSVTPSSELRYRRILAWMTQLPQLESVAVELRGAAQEMLLTQAVAQGVATERFDFLDRRTHREAKVFSPA